MRILVLDIAASKTGALSILRDFYKYVTENADDEDEWIFAVGAEGILTKPERSNISVIVREDVKASSKNRLMFEMISGKDFVKRIAPDAVFSLENTMPAGIPENIRRVLYIHQPLGFQRIRRFSLLSGKERSLALYQRFYHKLILSSAKRSDMCIVQTEWMKKALERDTGLRGERVARISPDIPDLSGYVREDKGVNNRFFYPASLILYKNHDLIEEARRILEKEDISCEVIYTKDKVLKREEVFEEYNRSTLLFPSYIETFGMPLAEAVQFGCVILAADTEFAKEVLCGYDKAYYFDPFNAGELAELMRKVIKGEIVRGTPKKVMETDSSYSRIVRMIKDAKG